jgi:hypothetical protein
MDAFTSITAWLSKDKYGVCGYLGALKLYDALIQIFSLREIESYADKEAKI